MDDAAVILSRLTDALGEHYNVITVNSGARAGIPVVMLTGMEGKRSVMEGIKLGIRDYILKPFDPNDLLERVQRILKPEKFGDKPEWGDV